MKYIRVIDFETTGFDPASEAIVELGWTDVLLPEGAPPRVVKGGHLLINPHRPIPPVASAVHHIIDVDVETAPSWDPGFLGFDAPPDGELIAYAAHNAAFEQGFAGADPAVPWICTYKAALRLWPDAPSHSNQALRYWRNPEGLHHETAQPAHRAFPDAYVTAFLLRDLIAAADGHIEALMDWMHQPALQIHCRFGEHKDKRWDDVPSDYLEWILRADFDADVRFTAEHHLDLRRAAAEAQAEVRS